MRSNSRLPAAGCMFVHIMCVRSACVGMPGRRSLAALRLHRAFSPVSTTILLRWDWGSLFPCCVPPFRRCRLAAEPARQQQRCLCRPGRPGQTHLFAECRSSDSERSLFAFWARPSRYVRAKKKHGLLEFTYLLPFPVFCYTIEKKMILDESLGDAPRSSVDGLRPTAEAAPLCITLAGPRWCRVVFFRRNLIARLLRGPH